MIDGVHASIYSREADGVRSFFRDILELDAVDAGGGWLIFALPPAELAVHPTDSTAHHELYLMCDDIEETIRDLDSKGVRCKPVKDEGWGLVTYIQVPGGDEIALYEPKHPVARAVS